jgi:hypothetical protein
VDSVVNREVYVTTTNTPFQLTDSKTMACEIKLQYAEAAGNMASVGFGFADAVSFGMLADNTGLPRNGFTGACIFKAFGSSSWQACSSTPTARNVSLTEIAAGGAAFVRLRIEIKPRLVLGTAGNGSPTNDVLGEVTYWIDNGNGLQAVRQNTPWRTIVKDQVTYTNTPAMQFWFGVKQGSNTPESLAVDYVEAGARI